MGQVLARHDAAVQLATMQIRSRTIGVDLSAACTVPDPYATPAMLAAISDTIVAAVSRRRRVKRDKNFPRAVACRRLRYSVTPTNAPHSRPLASGALARPD